MEMYSVCLAVVVFNMGYEVHTCSFFYWADFMRNFAYNNLFFFCQKMYYGRKFPTSSTCSTLLSVLLMDFYFVLLGKSDQFKTKESEAEQLSDSTSAPCTLSIVKANTFTRKDTDCDDITPQLILVLAIQNMLLF